MALNPSGPLPNLDLEEQSLLVIDTGDPAAIITRLVIHVAQDIPELPVKEETVAPLFTYAKGGTEAPKLTP